MHPTTLRGIFPDRPVAHRRNFIRENVRRIKQIQNETQELRSKSDIHGRSGMHSQLGTSFSKLKISEDGISKKAAVGRRSNVQKVDLRQNERRPSHISDLQVINNISHRSMQTEIAEDMMQIYASGVIKYPSSSAPVPESHRRRSGPNSDPATGDSPDLGNESQQETDMPAEEPSPTHSVHPAPKVPSVRECVPHLRLPFTGETHHRTDFIKHNVLALKARSNRKSATAEDGMKPLPNIRKTFAVKNRIPPTVKRQEDEAPEIDVDCPPGHVLLPEEERKETLRVLRESYAEKIQEMNSMPVRSDTLKMQKRKMDLETELKKVDEGIKVFQRPKVYVKVERKPEAAENGEGAE